jgi:hypothetical protein
VSASWQGFNGGDYAPDSVSYGPQDLSDFAPWNGGSVVEDYSETRVVLQIDIRIRGIDAEPYERGVVLYAAGGREARKVGVRGRVADWQHIRHPGIPLGHEPEQESVFVDVLEFSEGPQRAFLGLIASNVRLTGADHINLVGCEKIQSTALHGPSKSSRIVTDREGEFFCDLVRDHLTDSPHLEFSQAVNEVVERGASAVKAVSYNQAQILGETLSDDGIVRVLRSIVIGLAPDAEMTSTKGVTDSLVKSIVMKLRPVQPRADGSEISHDLILKEYAKDERQRPDTGDIR